MFLVLEEKLTAKQRLFKNFITILKNLLYEESKVFPIISKQNKFKMFLIFFDF